MGKLITGVKTELVDKTGEVLAVWNRKLSQSEVDFLRESDSDTIVRTSRHEYNDGKWPCRPGDIQK